METISKFWGPYRWLSNFYEAPQQLLGITFPTNEHYFQAMKADKPEDRRAIIEAATPGIAKRLARKIMMRDNWDYIRESVMTVGLMAKFEQNPTLMEKLIATHPLQLIEGNEWHDNFWGDCFCDGCKNVRGKNRLGVTLTRLRDEYIRAKD